MSGFKSILRRDAKSTSMTACIGSLVTRIVSFVSSSSFKSVAYCAKVIDHFRPGSGQFLILRSWTQTQLEEQMRLDTEVVTHSPGHLRMLFKTPNQTCLARAQSIWTKEPETIEWLSRAKPNATLFDIGANIGLYSVLFAIQESKRRVVAFEPSVQNVEQLVRNLVLNNLTRQVSVIMNPLGKESTIAPFRLSTMVQGEAQSSFDSNLNERSLPGNWKFEYMTLGMSLDTLFELKVLTSYPTMMKIDVDGGEVSILDGAVKTLKHPEIKSVLIEVGDSESSSAHEVEKRLSDLGFRNQSATNRPRQNVIYSRE